MSEPPQSPSAGEPQTRPATAGQPPPEVGRPRPAYQRSSGGLVGAMLLTVVVVLAFVGFRALTSDPAPTPVREVDYTAQVRAGRADGLLLVVAPPSLPTGWKATSATYTTGASPSWHLGMLTDRGKYVGIEESRRSVEDLATEFVDKDAERGKDVTIAGETWQTWTDRTGDYAVARDLKQGGRTIDSWIVVGSAPESQIRALAGRLEGGPTPAAG